MLNFFSDYPEGYDLTMVQTSFIKARKNERGKWLPSVLTMVARDNNTGKKIKTEIEDPDYEYFIANDGVDTSYHHFMISKENVHPVICKNSQLLQSIAENTDNVDFFNGNRRAGMWKENEKLHTVNSVFFSDMNIEDHYRFWFSKKYKNEYHPASKGFLDIEVDVIDIAGDFPEPGEAPVSVITYIFNNVIHTYIYRESKNPLIKQFEEDWEDGKYINELHDLITYVVGGEEHLKKFHIDNLAYQLRFFDEEIELIDAVFKDINEEQPDFVLAWNMAFDIPYLIARIENLGYKPEDIICHPDFVHKSCFYYVDERAKDTFAQRGDYARISAYTVYLDQMITFASRRKGQKALPSYSLNSVGEAICGVKKLDYHDITLNIAQLPYLDFKRYVFYNIVDVLVQVCIENETDDIAYVYSSSVVNNTRYAKVHRQTVYLNNRQASFYWDNGFVMGNNVNKFKEGKKEKFPGAFVSNPTLASPRSKYRIDNKPVMLFNNLIDYDFSSLYPSIIREFNLGPDTQIGKIVFQKDGLDEKENDMLGQRFIQDYVTHDALNFCHKWMGLPSFEEMADKIKDLIATKNYKPALDFEIYKNGVLEPFDGYYESDDRMRLPAFMKMYGKKNNAFLINHAMPGSTALFMSYSKGEK